MTTYIHGPGTLIKKTLAANGNASADYVSQRGGGQICLVVKAPGSCQIECWSVDRDGITLFDLLSGAPRLVTGGVDLLIPIDCAVRQLRVKVTDLSAATNAVNIVVDEGGAF